MEPAQLAQLKQLLDEVVSRQLTDLKFREGFPGYTVDRKTEVLKSMAQELNLDPEIVDESDIVGIEAGSMQKFLTDAYYRFFPGEAKKERERLP